MLTNELKKGARIQLANGWFATIYDNAKGNTRMAEVEGFFTEIGSVYAHDISICILNPGTDAEEIVPIEHTPAQLKLKARLKVMGW